MVAVSSIHPVPVSFGLEKMVGQHVFQKRKSPAGPLSREQGNKGEALLAKASEGPVEPSARLLSQQSESLILGLEPEMRRVSVIFLSIRGAAGDLREPGRCLIMDPQTTIKRGVRTNIDVAANPLLGGSLRVRL